MLSQGHKRYREIIPLKLIEPTENVFPFDDAIAEALNRFQQSDAELVLAFGAPFPNWISEGPGSFNAGQRAKIASVISKFLERMATRTNTPITKVWVDKRLTIEPLNEVNAYVSSAVNGTSAARLVADFDLMVKASVNDSLLFPKFISSSIITGSTSSHTEWYNSYYTNTSNYLPPNIHVYYNQSFRRHKHIHFSSKS